MRSNLYAFCSFLLALSLFSKVSHAQCPITVDAGPNKFVCAPGQTVELDGNISGTYLGLRWTPPTGLSNPNILNPTATVTNPVTYTLTGAAFDPSAPNLIFNPAFELGNTGFTTNLSFNPTPITPGTYTLTTSPSLVLSFFPPCDDHTFGNGTGNLMLINGTGAPNNQVWCQTVPVMQNSWYFLSAWVTVSPITPPTFQFAVNNTPVGTPFSPPNTGCDWQEFTAVWFSGAATTANVCIRNLNNGGNGFFGDDFALDDIFMSKACTVTDQVTVAVATVNAVLPPTIILPCSAMQNGIQLNGSGSSQGPGYTYSWDGPGILSGENTLIATVNEPGVYTLTVSFDTGEGICSKSASITVLPDPNMVTAEAAGGDEITCLQPTTQLDGTGSSVGPTVVYNWQPAANVVAGQGTLTPTVNQGGAYTLTVIRNPSGCSATATVTVAQNTTPPVAVASSPGPITCVPGTVTLKGTGSSVGFDITYQWSGPGIVSGDTTLNSCVVNAPGLYTLIVTNESNGCTARATAVVNQVISLPNAVANIEAPGALDCFTLSLVLNSNGSSAGPNFTYLWTTQNGNFAGPVNQATATVDSAGLYILTVTNTQNGCKNTDTVTVLNNGAPPNIKIKKPLPTLNCIADSVQIDAGQSSNGPEFVYVWTTPNGRFLSGDSTLTPWVDTVGTYIVRGLNTANGCTSTDTVKIVLDTIAPAIAIAPPATLNCLVDTAVIDASGSSGGPRIVFNWSFTPLPGGNGPGFVSGDTTLLPVVNAPGTYLLSMTDTLNFCKSVDSVIVQQDITPPLAEAGPADTLDCANTTVLLDGSGSNQGAEFNYLWTTGDTTLQASVSLPGTYSLTVTNAANGCSSADSTTVLELTELPEVAIDPPGLLNCGESELPLSATASAGPEFAYEWSFSGIGPGILSGGNTLTPTVGSAGDYTLLVTNTITGCTNAAGVTVIELSTVNLELSTQTNASCLGAADGALSVTAAGGDGQYIYEWNTGQNSPSLNNLPAGDYTVTVTDGEDCSAVLQVNIQQPEALSPNVSATAVSSPGNNDGTATANPSGGTAPYAYLWSTGESTQTITGLSEGLYTVTVTDANNCTAVQTIEVSDIDCSLAVSITATHPACNGQANGSAAAVANGGAGTLTYVWSSGADTQALSDLAAGEYAVTVTDENSCESIATVTLSEPPALTLELLNVVNTACPNVAEGSANVNAAGGTGFIEILWSNGQEGPSAANLIAGNYSTTATDANGCTSALQVTILANDQEPPQIQGGVSQLPLGVAGIITLTQQNLGLTIADNCAISTVEFVPKSYDCQKLGLQQVTVTAVDSSGNSNSFSFEVTVVDQDAPTMSCPADVRRCAGNDFVQYNAPVATDNCLLLGGQFALIAGLPSGSQFPEGVTTTTYTFTDASGNVGSCSFNVTILSPLVVVLDSVLNDVGGQNIGGIRVSVSGSLPGYSYVWQRDGQTVATTEDLSGAGAGAYTLLVTDAAGCTQQAGPFTVNNSVGATQADWSDLISVFPNPTSGKVFIVLPDILTDTDLQYTVFDALGRRVQELHSKGQKQTILDWTALADGLYTVVVRSETGFGVFRVVLGE